MQARRMFLAALWSLMAAPLVARVSGASSTPIDFSSGPVVLPVPTGEETIFLEVQPSSETRQLVGFSGGEEDFAWVELVYSDGGKAVLYLRQPANGNQILELQKDLRTQKAWELFGKDVYAIRLGEDPEREPNHEVKAGRDYIELRLKDDLPASGV